MKHLVFSVVVLSCVLCLSEAFANPQMIYKSGNKNPVALIGLDDVIHDGGESGCSNHIGFFSVDEISYDGVSDLIGGIRVKPIVNENSEPKANDVSSLIRIYADKLSNVDMGWIPTLVKKGTKLLIAYNRCGSGGFDSARDIYKADSLNW